MDKVEMERALSIYFKPGDVFEVRILDAVTPAYKRPHVESGYFEYEKIGEIYEALNHVQSYAGVYVTVNPVDPDLLSRAVNRIRNGRIATTADTDIIKRRWLLIDCDAVRKSAIASSDEEHQAALDKAVEVQSGLSSIGWASPIMIDSGNGAQLMYRVDLPADDGGLIQSAIHEITKASSDQVDIDLTVYNPARIWRLPGTMNRKGDHTERRPHRMAKILSIPDVLDIVTEDQLRGIITEKQEDVYFPNQISFTEFDLGDWIINYCPELLGKETSWKDGKKWVFDVCPFNSAHSDRSAVITQHSSGGISFKCHHNGCSGNDWKALRELRDPGYETKSRVVIDPNVDLSCFMNTDKPTEKVMVDDYADIIMQFKLEEKKKTPWRDITSDDVRKAIAGTLLGELNDIFASVTKPTLPIEASLLKAIVTLGCCLSGEASQEDLQRRYGGNLGMAMMTGIHRARLKINTGGGQGNNIYAILAGNSASGKDIGNLIDDFADFQNPSAKTDQFGGRGNYLIGTGGSAEGIAEALMVKPNGLILISELRDWLDERHWQHNATSFLTQAFNKAKFSATFSSRGGKSGARSSDYCLPSILANIQPQTFERLATLSNVETGFLGRFLFAKMPTFFGDATRFDPIALLKRIKEITDIFSKKRGIVEVPEDYTLGLKEIFEGNVDDRMNASWRRLSNEYYPRLAVQLSATMSAKTHGDSVILTEECWERAKVLTMWFFANAETMLLGVTDDSPFVRERELQFRKVFETIERIYDRTKKPVNMRMLGMNGIRFGGVKSTGKERQDAVIELEARGVIACVERGFVPLDKPDEWK